MILFTIYDLFTTTVWWELEKNPEIYTERKTKEKIPRLVALPSPRLRDGGRLFSGVRKQAGPTLGGTGALVYLSNWSVLSGILCFYSIKVDSAHTRWLSKILWAHILETSYWS